MRQHTEHKNYKVLTLTNYCVRQYYKKFLSSSKMHRAITNTLHSIA